MVTIPFVGKLSYMFGGRRAVCLLDRALEAQQNSVASSVQLIFAVSAVAAVAVVGVTVMQRPLH